MGSALWVMIGMVAIVSIISNMIVKLNKSGGSKAHLVELEDQVHDLEGDLLDARNRIEVLETIVTDQKFDLGREIDDLASS
jgi:hypothetical protein